jgi:hypothetical protein
VVENTAFLHAMGIRADSDAALARLGGIAEYLNDRKNAALYVGLKDGKFLLPEQQFAAIQAERTVRLAEIRLSDLRVYRKKIPSYSARKIGSLKGMPTFDETSAEQLQALLEALSRAVAAAQNEDVEGGNPDALSQETPPK